MRTARGVLRGNHPDGRLQRTERLLHPLGGDVHGDAAARVGLVDAHETTGACTLWRAVWRSSGERLRRSTTSHSIPSSGLAASDAVAARETLVVAEVAVACVLLVAGGLLLRSFARVLRVDLGFRPAGVVAWQLNPSRQFANDTQTIAYYTALAARVAAAPRWPSASPTRRRSGGIAGGAYAARASSIGRTGTSTSSRVSWTSTTCRRWASRSSRYLTADDSAGRAAPDRHQSHGRGRVLPGPGRARPHHAARRREVAPWSASWPTCATRPSSAAPGPRCTSRCGSSSSGTRW